VLDDTVIPLCAALAAQEHGDARKALMLLRYAGEVAVEGGGDAVVESDVREAQKRLESDKIVETVKTLPYHQRLTLYVIASNDSKEIGTNEIYEQYKARCEESGTTFGERGLDATIPLRSPNWLSRRLPQNRNSVRS
jgi:cell division control protein 6